MNIKNYLLSAALLFTAGTIYGFDNVTSGWTVYSCSSEASGEEGSNVLDDNDQTNWHTQWSGGTDPYPHTIVFLSDGTISLNAITILPRQNNIKMDYNPRSVQISASDDGENWSDVGTYAFANDRLLKTFYLPEAITPRYLRLYFAEGYSTFLALAEIDFLHYSEAKIEFEDYHVKEICVQHWDTNDDGEISEFEAYQVTELGSVFRGNTDITSFNELSNFVSLKNISAEAFMDCSNLEEITLPDGIQVLGTRAFKGCTKLSSINIPTEWTFIANTVFEGCTGLDSDVSDLIESISGPVIEFGDPTVKNICLTNWDTNGDSELSYSEAAAATSLSGFSTTAITSFNELQYFTGLTSIGYSAINGCSSLTSITLPDDVTSIGGRAFLGCTSLTSITLPDGITSIGESAFKSCLGLTSFTLPDGVTSIEESLFDNCQNLISIVIPDGVTSIGDNAFWGCSSLISIHFGNGVTSVAGNAFSNCYKLRSIHFSATTPKITYTGWGWGNDPILYVPDATVEAYKEAWGEYGIGVVPESSCNYVYDVTVSAQSDNSDVFTKIGDENKLKVVNLKVRGSINSYDVIAFRSKMLNLRNLDLSEATIVASEWQYLDGGYKTKDNVFTGYMVPSKLESLVLPTSITAMDANALRGCSYLKTLIIPESVTSIGSSAFDNCQNLQSITLPTAITKIPNLAFWGCKKLTSISIPRSVTSIGSNAFDDCYSLSSIDFPKELTSIGDYAFSSCNSLTSIDLPKGLKTIGSYAFEGCI